MEDMRRLEETCSPEEAERQGKAGNLCDQKDMETLRSWLKLAARVHTIEEFCQCICESMNSGMIENPKMTEENQETQ